MIDGTYRYSFEMAAPIGARRGCLEFALCDGHMNGALTLFEQTLPISSCSIQNGTIRFTGEMKTLPYRLPYTAVGSIDERSVQLVFSTEKGYFSASGTAVAGGRGGEGQYE